jgi:RHS repeat-associated protein
LVVKVNKINFHNSFPVYHKSLPLYRRRPNNRRKNISPGESGKFSSKEQDPETGFYYYGARYLDPRTSRWLSGDPAMGDYIPVAPINDEAKKNNRNLPGMGGVFNLVNLHVYHYAGNNPVKYTDPDGREDELDFYQSWLDGELEPLDVFDHDTAMATEYLQNNLTEEALIASGLKFTSDVSLAASVATIGATANGNIPAAGIAAAIGLASDAANLALSIASGDSENIIPAAVAVGIDVVPGMVSPKLNPHWNNTAGRFYNSSNGQFLKTMGAKIVNIAKATAGIAVGLFSRKNSDK